nr:xylulose kinase-like [Macaca nemestrina]
MSCESSQLFQPLPVNQFRRSSPTACASQRCWVRVSMTELVSARGTQRGGSNPGRRVTKATVGECGTKLEDTRVLLSKPHGPNQQPVWIPSRHLKPYHKPDAE